MMFTCTACKSFVPSTRSVCPACGSAVAHSNSARVIRGVLTLAGGSLFAMTLTACYGAIVEPRFEDAGPRADAPSGDATCADLDRDGYCAPADCNDTNSAIHPDAIDTTGDGVDSDCDGTDGMSR